MYYGHSPGTMAIHRRYKSFRHFYNHRLKRQRLHIVNTLNLIPLNFANLSTQICVSCSNMREPERSYWGPPTQNNTFRVSKRLRLSEPERILEGPPAQNPIFGFPYPLGCYNIKMGHPETRTVVSPAPADNCNIVSGPIVLTGGARSYLPKRRL